MKTGNTKEAVMDELSESQLAIQRTITDWLEAHPGTPLDPRTVIKTFPGIDPFQMVGAIWDMLDRDRDRQKFKRVYRLVMPDGSLAPDEYTEINQIPDVLNNTKVLPLYYLA
jgi:hypothetical protein